MVFLCLCVEIVHGASVRVISVIDGETLAVQSGTLTKTVRLIGIEPGGRWSADFLLQLVQGRSLFVEPDHGALVYAYRAPDGLFVNREMIRTGYARVSRSGAFRFRSEFLAEEAKARAARRGLWAENTFARDWETRFSGVKYLGESASRKKAEKPSQAQRKRPR